MKLEAIVFDFDGTLAELHLDFGEMKQRLGVLAGNFLRSVPSSSAIPALEWLEALSQEVQKTGAKAAGEFRHKAEELIVNMEMEAANKGGLFPFTRSVLTELRQRNIKIAIITRNCARAVRSVFPDLDRFCGVFLAREHVPRIKPDPDHLLRALRQVMAEPGAALMVGDHPIDIRTGKDAGVLAAGVWSGRASQEDLEESGARWTARNCRDLIQVLIGQDLI